MDSSFPYNGGMTAEQFLFYEIRCVSKFYLEGKNLNDILEIVKKDNLFQYPTEKQVARMTRACYKRLDALNDNNLVYELANAPLYISKQINLYAIMQHNRLFWEFMVLVIGEKFSDKDYSFGKKDLNLFFSRLQEQNDEVAGWSSNTITKLKQVLTKILVETEYLENNKSTELNNVYLYQELEDSILNNGDKTVLKAFNYFR